MSRLLITMNLGTILMILVLWKGVTPFSITTPTTLILALFFNWQVGSNFNSDIPFRPIVDVSNCLDHSIK